jgi:hypothetical protein
MHSLRRIKQGILGIIIMWAVLWNWWRLITFLTDRSFIGESYSIEIVITTYIIFIIWFIISALGTGICVYVSYCLFMDKEI